MDEYLESTIDNYCQMVERGCKPCAMFPVHERSITECTDLVISKGLLAYTNEYTDRFYELWIYIDERLLELIKEAPFNPKNPIDHFILGSLFGYSIESILDYIANQK